MHSNVDQNGRPCHIYGLHGFLGAPADWRACKSIDHPVAIKYSERGLWEWAHAFNASVKSYSGKKILLGYSLGGRLGMHALLSAATRWDGAIFVSAHPGLPTAAERALRCKSDQQWAARFLVDPWEDLMRDWHANAVFGGRPSPVPRSEREFDRMELSKQLLNWSLGKQEPLLPRLKMLAVPMLFISGELDQKFCHVAESFKECGEVSIIPDSAHRVPWEQPVRFINRVNQFINQLS